MSGGMTPINQSPRTSFSGIDKVGVDKDAPKTEMKDTKAKGQTDVKDLGFDDLSGDLGGMEDMVEFDEIPVAKDLTRSEIQDRVAHLNIPPNRDSKGSKFGRFLMGAAHSIRNLFSKAPDIKGDLAPRPRTGLNKQSSIVKGGQGETVQFDNKTIAKSLGLGDNFSVKPFDAGKFYPSGSPSLNDIKQNPKMQDCWLLSSIGAMIKSQGPESVEKLMTPGENGAVNVQLGGKTYVVPGEFADAKGNSPVSDSAPWVRTLETAMQMHRLDQAKSNTAFDSKSITMNYNSPSMALNALQNSRTGDTIGPLDESRAFLDKTRNMSGKEKAAALAEEVNERRGRIEEALRNNRPVVIGHLGGKMTLDKAMSALADGISPGHAVTVLNAARPDGKISVLDPYGRTRLIEPEVLAKCSIYIGDEPND